MPKYFDLEVSLLGIKPRIWRRFLIHSECTFMHLHSAIQKACGWENCHLYEFLDGKEARVVPPGFTAGTRLKRIARSDYPDPYDEEDDVPVADGIDLDQYFSAKGEVCFYIYDFGDYWQHQVKVEEVVEMTEEFVLRLIDGARAFPPEDCGGTMGYEDCCRVRAMSDDDIERLGEEGEETAWRKEWVGDWDPEVFDLKTVKKEFDYRGRRT